MDALLALLTLALQPRFALGALASIGAAFAFAHLVPGASAHQAIMLGCIGIAASALFGESKAAPTEARPAGTASSVFALSALVLGAFWGAASNGTSAAFLVGLLVQAAASWLWLRKAQALNPPVPQGMAIFAAVLALLGFFIGLGVATIAA